MQFKSGAMKTWPLSFRENYISLYETIMTIYKGERDMKKVYTLLVLATEVENTERILNAFRVGLNERDHSRVLYVDNTAVVNYTIVCEEEIFVSIVNVINGTRVY